MKASDLDRNNLSGLEREALVIASKGFVNREGGKFLVADENDLQFIVRRDESGRICCNCDSFVNALDKGSDFRCTHILAVKFALSQKATERATKLVSQTVTESDSSKFGEQKLNNNSFQGSADGHADTAQNEFSSLTEKRGEIKMIANTVLENSVADGFNSAMVEQKDNVVQMAFAGTLRNLRETVSPDMVKQRTGWQDREGQVHTFEYIEWHTVADILDEKAPDWSHSIKDIREIGKFVTVIVAITVDGITREGLGTGSADSEMGIKKAEHDALKRAAVKFGIARELYKKETVNFDQPDVGSKNDSAFPKNPMAATLLDLVTAKQLGMIRAISRELGIIANDECDRVMGCNIDELSKKAASAMIAHLQTMQGSIQYPLSKVS